MFAKILCHTGSRAMKMHPGIMGFNSMMRFATVAKGDKLPSAVVSIIRHDGETGFKNEQVDMAEYLQGKKVCIVGFPGAFTPVCTASHIPEFIAKAEAIKSAGCDEIIAISVNDPFVQTAYAESLGGKQVVNWAADGNGDFTKALGLSMDLSAAQLGTDRSVRYTLLVRDGQVIELNNEGDNNMTKISQVDRVME